MGRSASAIHTLFYRVEMVNIYSFHEFVILSHRFISQRNYIILTKKLPFWILPLTAILCFWPTPDPKNLGTALASGAKTCYQHFEKLHYAFISVQQTHEKTKKCRFFSFVKMGLFIGGVRKKQGAFQFWVSVKFDNFACWGGSKLCKQSCFFLKNHSFFLTPPHFLICVIGSQNVGGGRLPFAMYHDELSVLPQTFRSKCFNTWFVGGIDRYGECTLQTVPIRFIFGQCVD